MVRIDEIDKKILYALDVDSRIKKEKIAKSIEIPLSTLDYRINRLEKNRIILNYYAVINSFKLGYKCYRIYIKYQYINNEIKNYIIDHFVKSNFSGFVASLDGKYDLVVTCWVKDDFKFYNFIEKTFEKYSDYISNYKFSNYHKWVTFKPEYLLEDSYCRLNRKFELTSPDGEIIEIDKIDKGILKILSMNGNMKFNDIAKQLNLTYKMVNYRFKKFLKLGIIQGFRINIDLNKIGYKNYKVNIYLKDFKEKNNIIDYVKKFPHLWAIDYSIGYSNLEFEFHLENPNQMDLIMKDVLLKFPDAIKKYDYFTALNWHKFSWFL